MLPESDRKTDNQRQGGIQYDTRTREERAEGERVVETADANPTEVFSDKCNVIRNDSVELALRTMYTGIPTQKERERQMEKQREGGTERE